MSKRPFIMFPIFIYSPDEPGSGDSYPTSPPSKAIFYPIMLNNNCPTGIGGLFGRSTPFAIVWTIITIIINSINGMCGRWGIAHVFSELRKFPPFFANPNSPSAVPIPKWTTGICASIFDSLPSPVKPIVLIRSLGHSVFEFKSCYNFLVKASTAFAVSALKVINSHNFFCATVAFAFPKRISSAPNSRKIYNKPSSESATNKVFSHSIPYYTYNGLSTIGGAI